MDLDYIHGLKTKVSRELERLSKGDDLAISNLEKIDTLAHIFKDLNKILITEQQLEDDEGMSGAYRKRDRYGRYSGGGNRYMADGTYYMDGNYSRDAGHDNLMTRLGEMMNNADPKQRDALKECMRALERI